MNKGYGNGNIGGGGFIAGDGYYCCSLFVINGFNCFVQMQWLRTVCP